MVNATVESVLKHSLLCSYVLSQPLQGVGTLEIGKVFAESEQMESMYHSETDCLLQKKLSQMTYFYEQNPDYFAVVTEHAINKFQDDYHLEIEGPAERKTLSEITEKKIRMKQLVEFANIVEPGMDSDDVKIVQEALYFFGYLTGDIDGKYGPLTYEALMKAQTDLNIELTKEDTLELVNSLYPVIVELSTESLQASPVESEQVEPSEDVAEDPSSNDLQVEVVASTEKVEVIANNTDVIQSARSLIGTPYVYGGTSPSGFDCSGFIQYVFQHQDIVLPRTVSDLWNFSKPVSTPSVGDLVFFTTYNSGPSHAGIYVGDGKFIHAGSSRGVEISELNNTYWQERYLGAGRVR
ncbi:NlpC/P60 family protein [Oceanobacillus saliphilus]|uniref:NlpC/P60 family protein n=1 Tax=Oceanobacillus saliphilus TaxID=2925834 RepID=UPI00201E1C90|nr:NlpC/P60 family protein [Oceanobacillus saliphilus]